MNPNSLIGREARDNPAPAFHLWRNRADTDARAERRAGVTRNCADLSIGYAKSLSRAEVMERQTPSKAARYD
jgi:hypothetical protein